MIYIYICYIYVTALILWHSEMFGFDMIWCSRMFGSRPRSLHVPHAALAISDADAKVRSSVSSWHRHGEAARGTRLSVAARFVAVSSGISTRTAPRMLHATLPLHGWHKEALDVDPMDPEWWGGRLQKVYFFHLLSTIMRR
jgi:hypothetical protein